MLKTVVMFKFCLFFSLVFSQLFRLYQPYSHIPFTWIVCILLTNLNNFYINLLTSNLLFLIFFFPSTYMFFTMFTASVSFVFKTCPSHLNLLYPILFVTEASLILGFSFILFSLVTTSSN